MKRKLKAGVASLLTLALVLGMIPTSVMATSGTEETATSTTKQKSPASYDLSDGGYLVSGDATVTDANGEEVVLDETNPVITAPGDYTIVTTTADTVYSQVVSLYYLGDVNLDGTPGKANDCSALNALTMGKELESAAEYAADLDNDETISKNDLTLLMSVASEEVTLDDIKSQYHIPAVTYDFIGGDEVMPIIGFYGPYYGPKENGKSYDFLNDKTYQMVKDSGINIINYTVNRIGDGYDGLAYLKQAMELGDEYGIGYYITDFYLNPERDAEARAGESIATNITFGSDAALSSAEVANQIGQYSYYESYLGTNVSDEPYPNKYDYHFITGTYTATNNQLKYYDLSAKTMNQYTNNLGFVNTINPSNEAMYDNDALYKYTFSSMLDETVKAIDSKVISYTSYPFSDGDSLSDYANASDTTITKDSTITDYEHWAYYYQGLWETRAKAAEAKIPFWTYVAAGGDWRDGSETTETVDAELPTEAETYWDVNNKLAFGAKGIEWFTALQPWYFSLEGDGNDYDRNGLIGNDGTPTPFYWYAQEINNHIAAIDHVLMKSNSTGIMAIGDDTVKMVQSGIMDESNALRTSTDMLTSVSGGGSLGAIVGCFDYKDTEAFYVVNQSVDETQEFTLTFADEYAYSYYMSAKKQGGYGSSLTLSIAPGEGVLVVLDEVSGFLAEPIVASGVYYDVEVLADAGAIMHSTSNGDTAFENLPDYLQGLYYLRTSTFAAVEATFIADCYAYVLASEQLVANLRTQGYKCVASYAKADIMTGYYAGKDNVSTKVYLMEKQVEHGETVTYGNGTNWATLMTSPTQVTVTTDTLLAEIDLDSHKYNIAQISDSTQYYVASSWGTFNTPEYLENLYFVQVKSGWHDKITATAKADCYFYMLVGKADSTQLVENGFKVVKTYTTKELLTTTYGCDSTLYLLEKQMSMGDQASYSCTYYGSKDSNSGWGTLITSPTKLKVNQFAGNVSLNAASHSIVPLENGTPLINMTNYGTFQNLPDYLTGLEFVQISSITSTWPTVTVTANADCYFYPMVNAGDVSALRKKGYKVVATYAQADIIKGGVSGCPPIFYLMEKAVESGESVTYRCGYYKAKDDPQNGWGTLMTSATQLDIPATEKTAFLADVSLSEGTYTIAQMGNGMPIANHSNLGTIINVPKYLEGLNYVQITSAHWPTVEVTANADCYFYPMVNAGDVSALRAQGYKVVATYNRDDVITGGKSGCPLIFYLMEKAVESGESVTYRCGYYKATDDPQNGWGTLMTSATQLEIPVTEKTAFLADVSSTGTYTIAQMSEGMPIVNISGYATVTNVPEYLQGLNYVQTTSTNWPTITVAANADCYFYPMVNAGDAASLQEKGYKIVATYNKADIIDVTATTSGCSPVFYLMEKAVESGESVTYRCGYYKATDDPQNGWGTLMTSPTKLAIPMDSSVISAGCVTDPNQQYSVVRMENGATLLHPTPAGNTAFKSLPKYLEGLYFVQPRGIYEMKAAPKVDGYAYILTHEALVDDLKTKGFAEVASYAQEDIITPFGYYYDTKFSDTMYLMEKQVTCGEEITYGSTSYSATYIFSNERLAISNEAEVIGNTVTLNGALDVNYYVNKGTAKKLALKFTMEDGSVLTVSDNSYDEAKNAYIFTYSLPAKHMTDNVKARLFDGSHCVGEYEFSIQKYSEKLLQRSDVSDEIKTLVKNMLHYGAYVQQYFAYNTSILANDGLEALDLSGVTQSTFESYKTGSVVESDFGTIVGANLNLKSETVLNLYIQPKDGINVDDFTFKCGETTLTKGTYKGLTMVTVSGIAANELDTIFEIQAVSSDSTYSFKYSVFTYAYNALSDSYTGRTGLKDMIKAMYQYNQAAKEVQ